MNTEYEVAMSTTPGVQTKLIEKPGKKGKKLN